MITCKFRDQSERILKVCQYFY